LGGRGRNRIARLNPDGTVDVGFDPNANSEVGSMAVQTDGRILVGGSFTTIAGRASQRMALLNPMELFHLALTLRRQ